MVCNFILFFKVASFKRAFLSLPSTADIYLVLNIFLQSKQARQPIALDSEPGKVEVPSPERDSTRKTKERLTSPK